MALALNPNGSGIPGLDDTPRKPSRVLVLGLGVSAAAHLTLIGYLAYQKQTQTPPPAEPDNPFVIEQVYTPKPRLRRRRTRQGRIRCGCTRRSRRRCPRLNLCP